MKNVRLLFQGDSITDAGRDKRNFYDLGSGYPKYAAPLLREANPEINFEVINLGISGNRTGQLFDRLYPDAIMLQPDVISILIGVNDVWHRGPMNYVATTDEQIELNYREILRNLKAKTSAKIVMIAPYLLDVDNKDDIKEGLATVIPIIKRLAFEFADVYIPLDELFAEALKTQPQPQYYSADGVHPNENGAKFIAEQYALAVSKLFN